MIVKTAGIVLRVSPFSRTSHVVTWITPDHGKVTTVVKGAVRPRSMFLGQYDLFYCCELLFYAKERNGTHIIRECSPLNTRLALRENWRAVVCASYVTDLVSRVSSPAHANMRLFAVLDECLDHVGTVSSPVRVMLRAELAILEAIGLSPRLARCASCDVDIVAGDQGVHFSSPDGGMLCNTCASISSHRLTKVGPAVLGTMIEWQEHARSAPHTPPVHELPASRKDFDASLVLIGRILGLFVEYHVHSFPRSRRIAADLLH